MKKILVAVIILTLIYIGIYSQNDTKNPLVNYGYKNIYELENLISINNPKIKFEGNSICTI